ncbi:hypothetical protein [Brucella intermedia]|uniref:hypothetical protein n=1 Tax=Brucella intermedia TaxID=94625 RepID=UPI00124DCE16|nr:hypothetical protein [Brucella intermedia]KAB2721509.1 hypothetical protein F9L02_23015 [Brucella intermedia]
MAKAGARKYDAAESRRCVRTQGPDGNGSRIDRTSICAARSFASRVRLRFGYPVDQAYRNAKLIGKRFQLLAILAALPDFVALRLR